MRTSACFVALVLTCDVLAAADWPMYAEDPLAGTRRGPTGWYLSLAERAELRERVERQTWAKRYLETEVLPQAAANSPLGPSAGANGLGRRGPLESALAYAATGDRMYGDLVRGWLLYAARRWNTRLPDSTIAKPPYNSGVGNCAWGVPMAGAGTIPMHVVYDLAADSLAPDEEKVVRQAIKEIVDFACNWIKLHGGNPNMNFIALTDYYEWAASVGYEKQMEWILHHKKPESNHGGLLQLLDDYLNDGLISKESPIYHTISLRVVGMGMAAWRYNGQNWFSHRTPSGNTLKGMLDGLVATAWPIMKTGYYQGTIAPANWGHGGTTYCGDVAVVNRPSDAHRAYSAEEAMAHLLRVYPEDPSYRYLISLTGRAWKQDGSGPVGPVVLDDWLHGPLGADEAEKPAAAPCGLFPQAGIAMLRFPETGDYWQQGIAAWLHGGELSRGHLADPSLMLFGAGRILFPQFLTCQYEDPLTTGWCMLRPSRNTITIDGRDGLYSYSTYRRSFDPEVKFVSLRCHPYLEAEMERAGFLTAEYLVDLFQAQVLPTAFPEACFPGVGGSVYFAHNASLSEDVKVHPGQETNFYGTTRAKVYGPRKMPASHTFDYTLHGLGRQFAEAWPEYRPSDEFRLSQWAHRWVWNERVRETADAVSIDWVQSSAHYVPDLDPGEHRGWDQIGPEWFKDRAGVRTRVLGEPGTKVFLADGPMRWGPVDETLTPEEKVPLLAVRRSGKAAFYAALHEPFQAQPAIRSYRYLNRPETTGPTSVVGVEVAGPDYTDRVYLTMGLPGLSTAPGARAPAPDDPPTTVADQDDAGQGIAYRGQAYLRIKGEFITARGRIEGLCLYAPAVRKVVLNGRHTEFRRQDGYVVLGAGPWQPARVPAPPPATPASWTPPLQASLPQRFVNIHALTSGALRVRVDHLDAPGAKTEPARGRIEVTAGDGVSVTPATMPVPALAVKQHQEFSFVLRGGRSGSKAPLTIKLFVQDAGKERLAHEIATDVSSGVTVEEVRQAYDHPIHKDLYTLLKKDRRETFDRLRVRAPGYTIEIDRFSGTSRSMIDPEGHERVAAAGYPLQFTRGYATFAADVRDGAGRHPYEVPCVPGGPDKPKVLGWWSEAKFLGQGTDAAGGAPTLRFQTEDGQYELTYEFQPDLVTARFRPLSNDAPPQRLQFAGLCVDDPSYGYRPWVRDAESFGFRVGPDAIPAHGQNVLVARPYYTFRTYPQSPRAGSPRAGNLLAIGGFEAPADKHGELAGWTVDAAAKASCTLDSAVKRSGAKSLRYDLVKAVNPQLHATFETRAGRTCRLGLWLRCDGVLAALDANGRVPQAGWAASSVRVALDQPPYWHAWNQFHPAYWPGGSTGLWQRVEFDLPRAPSDGPVRLSLELHLGVCQAGTVWVDDVDLREVE